MRLERMMCRFLLPGQCSVTDERLTATLVPAPGETVLAFRPEANDPELCGPRGGIPIADALFVWKGNRSGRTDSDWSACPVVLAVECKTSMVDSHAIDQVTSLLGVTLRDMQPAAIGRVAAVVLTDRVAPDPTVNAWRKRLKELTGIVLEVHKTPAGTSHDLRPSLERARSCRVAAVVDRIGKPLLSD